MFKYQMCSTTIRRMAFVSPRSESGSLMVELMVAVLVSSVMMGALVNTMAMSHRLTTAASSQVIATAIAQEVIDSCRTRSFDDLQSTPGLHTLTVQGNAISCPAFLPRPLLIDTDLRWDDRTQGNQFRGTVTATVTNIDANNSMVNVLVSWRQGTGTLTSTLASRISRNGIHAG